MDMELDMEVEYNNTHQIGGGNRYVTWTFAEIKQYAADCHDFEDGHELKFMSNVHEDISVGENCVKAQIPIQKITRLSRLNLLQTDKVHKIQVNSRTCLSEMLESVRTFLFFSFLSCATRGSNPRPHLIYRLGLGPYLYKLTI